MRRVGCATGSAVQADPHDLKGAATCEDFLRVTRSNPAAGRDMFNSAHSLPRRAAAYRRRLTAYARWQYKRCSHFACAMRHASRTPLDKDLRDDASDNSRAT